MHACGCQLNEDHAPLGNGQKAVLQWCMSVIIMEVPLYLTHLFFMLKHSHAAVYNKHSNKARVDCYYIDATFTYMYLLHINYSLHGREVFLDKFFNASPCTLRTFWTLA